MRDQAGELRFAFSRGDPEARSRVFAIEALARLEHEGAGELTVTQSQFVIAREYGFRSWPDLKRTIEEKLRALDARRIPMDEQKRNIKIDVGGTIPPGVYGSIEINGIGKAEDDIQADVVTINGVCNFGDGVKAGKFISNGACNIADSLQADVVQVEGGFNVGDRLEGGEIKINGGCRVGDDVKAAKLKIDGGFSVGDGLVCDTAVASGDIRVGDAIEVRILEVAGSLSAEEVRASEQISAKGSVHVDESIDAGEVDLEADVGSRAGRIKARRIRIRGRAGDPAAGPRMGGQMHGMDGIAGLAEHIAGEVQRAVVEMPKVAEEVAKEVRRTVIKSGFAGRITEAVRKTFRTRAGAKVSEAEKLRGEAERLEKEARKLEERADELESRAEAMEEEAEIELEKTEEETEDGPGQSPKGGR